MANTVNYAEVWQPELVEVMSQNTLCTPFLTSAVKWLDARTFHFTSMSTSGFKNHSRAGGWNRGTFRQTDHPFTVTHDRDVEFLVDKADVDESNATASVQNIARTFTLTQSAPEKDALFFSKVAATAKAIKGCHSETAASAYTPETVLPKLKAMLNQGRLRYYRGRGGLILYVTSDIMNALEQSPAFTRVINVSKLADGGAGLETRVTDLDGVPVMEVVDDEVFCDAFAFDGENGGFAPAAGAHRINALLATPKTTKLVSKINSIYFFAPGTHTAGDGYLYQERELCDVFTFPNGRDGKVDSVFVDTDTAEVKA